MRGHRISASFEGYKKAHWRMRRSRHARDEIVPLRVLTRLGETLARAKVQGEIKTSMTIEDS